MRNSKGCSMKQGHLCQCEDQRNQDHKKTVKEKQKTNSFVIREIPIRRLCNASNDLSRFTKGKNFSAGMNVMDYDMPELVVFIQEDNHQQFVKDVCINRGVSLEGNGIREAMSINSAGSECGSLDTTLMDAMKIHDFRNFRMKGQVEHDSGDKILPDHITKKSTSETLREAFKKERELSRSFKKWQINSCTGTSGSRVEFPHCTDFLQVTNIKGSGKSQVDDPQNTSNPTSCHAKSSSFASHQSNDSIGSNHSFAFPILPVEWNGSPVRMVEADTSQSRKQRWRKIWPPCCDCDC